MNKTPRLLEFAIGTDAVDRMRRENMLIYRLIVSAWILVGVSIPALAQKAAIERVNAQWTEYFNKGDFRGVASLYTADAVALPPGSAMVKGRAAIEAMWKGMAEHVTDPKVTTVEVKRLGPSTASEAGTFSLKTKEPTPKEINGKYLVLWQRVHGRWKLAADIWNDGK
jgi:uncharacterized protein (TIGR02246 family)